jgi:hypothetical protein
LKAFKPIKNNQLLSAGNTLSQRTFRSTENEVITKFDISGMTDGHKTGLCHFSKEYGAIGIVQMGGLRRLGYWKNDSMILGDVVTATDIWFRSVWELDGKSQFSYSLDGHNFINLGEPYQMQWGNYRGDRIGIFCFNDKEENGIVDVDYFEYNLF